jgi:hypothetical protein
VNAFVGLHEALPFSTKPHGWQRTPCNMKSCSDEACDQDTFQHGFLGPILHKGSSEQRHRSNVICLASLVDKTLVQEPTELVQEELGR